MDFHTGDQLIDPELLFEKAHLHPAMHIADFGCGRTGHIIFPARHIVGENGVIYGVDILKEAIESVRRRAEISNAHNVHTVWSNIEWPGKTAIPEHTLDVVFIINVLCHVDNRHGVLEEAFRLLKDKARIVVVDWLESTLSLAPEAGHYVDFDNIVGWARLRHMAIQEIFEAGSHHQGIVLYKS
jgi:ubiquinone/menaquinone biosynthesis C-methylase UbiE